MDTCPLSTHSWHRASEWQTYLYFWRLATEGWHGNTKAMVMALGYEYNSTKADNEACSLRDPEVFGTNVSDLNPGTTEKHF